MITLINRTRLVNGLKFENNKVNFRLISFTKKRHHNPDWCYIVKFDITIGEFKRNEICYGLATDRENVNADEIIKLAIDYYTFLAKKIESEHVH